MVEAIVPSRAADRFGCGSTFENLMVINFSGPGGVKASAYCCNVNVDIDGEPQAYGPSDNPDVSPKENLWNGGWLNPAQNAIRKKQYDDAKKKFDDLEQKKADILAKAKVPAGPAAPPSAPPDPAAMAALDKEIADAKEAMKKTSHFWNDDPAKRPKNFGKIFWYWYGPSSLTPEDARGKTPFQEPDHPTAPPRRPKLDDQKPELEDVYGAFPIIQSIYEPGKGYYVSGFPARVNTAFPDWDQRAFLPPGAATQVPNAALSLRLEAVTSLRLNDMVLGMRLDGSATLEFPFLDHGRKPKVGECSVGVFTGLGGHLAADINSSNNDFLVLYLAFAKSAGQTADSMLTRFASAPNADDFPVMLAFVAQTTLNAKAGGKKVVDGDPLTDFRRWKASQGTRSPAPFPSTFAVVDKALSDAGFSPFTQRLLKRHPSLVGGGPWLKFP